MFVNSSMVACHIYKHAFVDLQCHLSLRYALCLFIANTFLIWFLVGWLHTNDGDSPFGLPLDPSTSSDKFEDVPTNELRMMSSTL